MENTEKFPKFYMFFLTYKFYMLKVMYNLFIYKLF